MRRFTSDEREIKAWAVRRSAYPVEHAPYIHDSEPTKLGFVFGAMPVQQEALRPIDWATFFALFRLMGLVLAYDDDLSYELLKAQDESSEWSESKPVGP